MHCSKTILEKHGRDSYACQAIAYLLGGGRNSDWDGAQEKLLDCFLCSLSWVVIYRCSLCNALLKYAFVCAWLYVYFISQ